VQHHHLVEARGRALGDGARLTRLEHAPAAAQIDDDDLVADAVHLAKGDAD
jgi:hypothetical protein